MFNACVSSIRKTSDLKRTREEITCSFVSDRFPLSSLELSYDVLSLILLEVYMGDRWMRSIVFEGIVGFKCN